MSELKPCPKCGWETQRITSNGTLRGVICANKKCDAATGCLYVDEQAAIDAWNALPREDKPHGEHGEPWKVRVNAYQEKCIQTDSYKIGSEPGHIYCDIDRIVTCVNALRGIKDVQKFVDAVRELVHSVNISDNPGSFHQPSPDSKRLYKLLKSMMEGE
jgi:hypothetical protein